jgi:hypothetical protein
MKHRLFDVILTLENGTKFHYHGLEAKAAREKVFQLQREHCNARIEHRPSRKSTP